MRENQLRPSDYIPTEQEIRDAFFRDFYKESKVNNPDPNSCFHPDNAIGNSSKAFQASTSPEAQKIKKKIYVSGNNVAIPKNLEYQEILRNLQNLINLGFEVFFVCDDEILKLESITDDKIKFSNNKLGKINNYSIDIISYNENKIKKLSQKSDQEILDKHQLVADDSYFLTQKELKDIDMDYNQKYLTARLGMRSRYAYDDGSYFYLENFVSDLDYFSEKHPEKKSAIKKYFEDYYIEIEKPPNYEYNEQKHKKAMIGFLEKISEIVEIRIFSAFFDSGSDRFFKKFHSTILTSEIITNYKKSQDEQSSINSINTKKNQNSLYLGNGNSNPNISTQDNSQFELKKIGSKIKGDALIRPRIATYKLNIKTNSSPDSQFFEEISATEFTILEKQPTLLYDTTENTSLKKNIFQFDDFELKQGIKTRLYSVDSEEELLNYQINSTSSISPHINFFKGDDGFYYAQSNQDCSITYQVGFDRSRYLALAKKKTFTAQDFGGNELNPVNSRLETAIHILNEYQGQDHFKPSVTSKDFTLPKFTSKQQFAEDLYKLKSQGSCSHRTLAIAHQFEKNGLKSGEDYRIINIEKTHILVEIKGYDGKFYQVDLGGQEAEITIKKNSQEVSTLVSFPSTAPTPISLAEASLIQAIDEQTTIQKIDELETFKNKILKEKSKNILIQTSEIENCTNFLIKQSAVKTKIFQANSPLDLKIDAQTIEISRELDSSNVKISDETPFSKFLTQAKSNPNENYQLIINWENFTSNEKVAFNSLFDSGNRSVNQQEIPNNIQIIAVEKPKEIKDPSVLSRFDKKISLSRNLEKQISIELITKSSEEQSQIKYKVDLEGDPDWQGKLFGKIKLNGDNLDYEKSEFVKFLEETQSSENLNIEFENISPQNAQELSKILESSRVRGYYDYNGKKISIPSDLQFSFSAEQFDFKSLSKAKISCTTDYVASLSEIEDLKIINQSDFEKLLVQVKIPSKSSGETYHELPGLIKDASSKDDKKLSLLITSKLSTNQWYLLLKKAQENEVQLDLKIAKGINLPDNPDLKKLLNSQHKFSQEEELELLEFIMSSSNFLSLKESRQKRIFIVDDSSKYIEKNSQGISFLDSIIIDIEEQNFDSLFGKRDFEIKKSQDDVVGVSGGKQSFAVYKESNGLDDILEKNPDKKIILRGEFDDKTMQILTEKMLSADPKYQNLYFILEDKNLTETSQESELQKLSKTSLAFLGADFYEEKTLKPRVEEGAGVRDLAVIEEGVKKPIIRETIPSIDTFYTKTDEQITQTSETFKAQRKALIEQQLQANKMLLISGSAGVGKSYFMQSLAKEQDHQIFFGKDKIKEWAKSRIDETETSSIALEHPSKKLSILVIDEYNVDGSTNYLMFRDLDKKKYLYHQGEVLELQDHHRVVFMGNNLEYGNRFQQKLFAKESIQEIELKDFPSEYIYEEIIKKPIFGEKSHTATTDQTTIKATTSAEITGDFKIFCQNAIKEYKTSNQGGVDASNLKQKPITVRGLQETVLGYLSKEISEEEKRQTDTIQSSTQQTTKITSENFIETSATTELCQKLSEAIQIRKHQFSGKISSLCVGTPGFIIEGDAGIGKSAMIEAVLNHQNITEVKSLEDLEKSQQSQQQTSSPSQQQHYYKINASGDIEKIKKDLIKAYELGVIVVFDEINAKIQEGGLEQIINDLLTNQHPEKKGKNPADPSNQTAKANKAGFMLIGSINSASSSGRAQLSPAIQSRCNYQKAKKLTDYTNEDLKEIIEHWKQISSQPISSSSNITDSTENLAIFLKKIIQKKPEFSLRDITKIILNVDKIPNKDSPRLS